MDDSAPAGTRPLRVFISYAHEDDELREKFARHLRQLQRDGLIEGWDDRGIAPGSEWAGVLDERLKSAEIVILLVSGDFLASDYCNEIELKTALERQKRGETRVVPVILRPCDWQSSRFGSLQALPKDGVPVVDWKTEDHGFLNVVQGLRSTVIGRQKGTEHEQQLSTIGAVRRRWPIVAATAVIAALAVGGVFWMRHERARRVAQYVTHGDALMDQSKWTEAEDAYKHAQQSDPNVAEPYARLGYLYDLERDPQDATKMYESAVKYSGSSPDHSTNLSNLADQYFKLGQYRRAVATYGSISRFPLAAVESAKINLLRNKLDEAEEENRTAINWLSDGSITELPQNKLPWYFVEAQVHKRIEMVTPNEKLCYAEFELSLTLHLKGNEPEAKKLADMGRQSCGARLRDIAAELRFELVRLADERSELTDGVQSYVSGFLGS